MGLLKLIGMEKAKKIFYIPIQRITPKTLERVKTQLSNLPKGKTEAIFVSINSSGSNSKNSLVHADLIGEVL